jgi:hypothetical protein
MGMRWWEVDVQYLCIRALQCVGLAWDVVQPHRQVIEPPSEPQRRSVEAVSKTGEPAALVAG